MFIVYRTRDKRKEAVAECETKEEGMKAGEEAFAKAEKGDTFILISPCEEGASLSSDGELVGKYRLYKYWD